MSNTEITSAVNLCPNGPDHCPVFEKIERLYTEISTLRTQANVDELTGLYNRRFFDHTLAQESERTARTQQATSLIMIDIDHFKSINDQYGHQTGDTSLTTVARLIQANCRKLDVPCRYGGEEFAIVLPTTPLLIAVQVAERLRKTISAEILHTETGDPFSITASFGVETYCNTEGISLDDFVSRADSQLYRAKHEGRNQVCYKQERAEDKTQVSQDEKDALFMLMNTNDKE